MKIHKKAVKACGNTLIFTLFGIGVIFCLFLCTQELIRERHKQREKERQELKILLTEILKQQKN